MKFRELLQEIYDNFGERKFKAKDVYEFYTRNSPSIPFQPETSLLPSGDQKHHTVIDLRKLCHMGLLRSRSYKGRWQEYWITSNGIRYLEYMKRSYEERMFEKLLELKATLTSEERAFVEEYIHGFLRVDMGIALLESFDNRKYSTKERRVARMLASSNLAQKHNIPPARQREIIDKLTSLLEGE